jgi:GNAT superfamily N-acetyltransferase
MVEIKLVRTDEDAAAVHDLAYEFIDWLRERYPERHDQIADYLRHQNFAQQVKDVRPHYTPPKGECLIAVHRDRPVGLLMMKDKDGTTCEMNRMFVRPDARGLGVGRALIARLLDRAKEMGFATMNLGALPRHVEALPLYRSMGFQIDNRPKDAGTPADAILMTRDLTLS